MSEDRARPLDELLGDAIEQALRQFPRRRIGLDVERAAYLLSSFESARYFCERMSASTNLVTRQALLQFALAQAPGAGLTLEFGVASGRSLRVIAAATEGPVFGFDSFEGLPEDWSHFQKKGRFSLGGKPPESMPAKAHCVVGWFKDTLPAFLDDHPGPVRFVHVDCDIYSSAKTVLDGLAERLRPGSVIVFDEYFNYPGWQHHEFKAFQEFVAANGVRYEYLGFASSYYSVAVRIQEIAAQP